VAPAAIHLPGYRGYRHRAYPAVGHAWEKVSVKRLLAVALAAATSIALMAGSAAAAAAPAAAGPAAAGPAAAGPAAAAAHRIGSCRAQGSAASCDVTGTARHPRTIHVHVTASPGRRLLVRWHITCSRGLRVRTSRGHFRARTPIRRGLRHRFTHPGSCIVTASTQLPGSGRLHLWLTSRR
jgi:hypothetical protein